MSSTPEPTYAEMKAMIRDMALDAVRAAADLPPPVTEKEKRSCARMLKTMDAMITQIFGNPVGSA